MSAELLLVGAGPMARAFYAVTSALSIPTQVIGRGAASASTFADEFGVRPTIGGLEDALHSIGTLPGRAIVAVPIPELAGAVRLLASAGVGRVLVEKPAGLTIDEIIQLSDEVEEQQVDVRVGYNRRFYGSTRKAREIIADDGGATSLRFEFTELIHRVEQAVPDPRLRASWFLANSSHVVDLAFHLAGQPSEWHGVSDGGRIGWHSTDRFAGSGITETGAFFSYFADWNAPGRWGVEVMTTRNRLILQPLEELRIRRARSSSEEVVAATSEDRQFKPGIMDEVRSFMDDGRYLPTIHSHAKFAGNVLRSMMTGHNSGADQP